MSEYTGYFPRKCSYTRQIITASDRASIQLSIKKEFNGLNEKKKSIYVISGNLRRQGKSDSLLNNLIENDDNE